MIFQKTRTVIAMYELFQSNICAHLLKKLNKEKIMRLHLEQITWLIHELK